MVAGQKNLWIDYLVLLNEAVQPFLHTPKYGNLRFHDAEDPTKMEPGIIMWYEDPLGSSYILKTDYRGGVFQKTVTLPDPSNPYILLSDGIAQPIQRRQHTFFTMDPATAVMNTELSINNVPLERLAALRICWAYDCVKAHRAGIDFPHNFPERSDIVKAFERMREPYGITLSEQASLVQMNLFG